MSRVLPGLWEMPNSHPIFVHFPIVLLPMALLFWGLALRTRRDDLFRFGRWLLYLGVGSALLSGATGLWAMERMGHHFPHHDEVHAHQNFMFATAALATGVAIAAFLLRNRPGTPVRFLLSAGLLVTVTVLMLGADRGARLVYIFGIGTRKADPGDGKHDPHEKHEHDKKPDPQEHGKHDEHGMKEPEQDGKKPAAESVFRQFEKKLADAKSVSLKFESEMEKGGKKTKRAGMVRLKPEHRLLLSVNFAEAKDRDFLMRSDGQRMALQKGNDPAREQPFMKEMSRFITAAVARSGLGMLELVDLEVAPDPEKALQLSDFSLGEGDRIEVKVILYTLTIQGQKAAIRLWLDVEKMIPVMRKVKVGDLAISETYSEFSTEEVADEEFRPPSTAGQKRFACPMNCATSDKPGPCPKCGMEMREVK